MLLPITDDDVPGIVTLMNRAYRGTGTAGWSTQEPYLSGDRITEDVLRADLLAKPHASLLKWEDPEGGPLLDRFRPLSALQDRPVNGREAREADLG